jgi:glucose/arabinose dehydrogenase
MILRVSALMFAGLLSACAAEAPVGKAPSSADAPNEASRVIVEDFARGLDFPWGIAFLPEGEALVTEKGGALRVITMDGAPTDPVLDVPKVVDAGQGGLMDVAVDPNFAENKFIYLTYAEADGKLTRTAVMRARFEGQSLSETKVIFRQEPALEGEHHFGSRLAFDRSGALIVTLGERYRRELAQDQSNTLGKVVRIDREGRPAKGNPSPQSPGARRFIYTYGHRNVQGVAIDPASGDAFVVEHGPRGGDEINVLKAGANYGWPLTTYGIDYTGLKISDVAEAPGIEGPLYYWNPSIAPSGMDFYVGDAFPEWRGDLLVTALAGMALHRLTLKDGKIVNEEKLLTDVGERLRAVRVGPDGFVYVLTDSPEGRILRLKPAA